MFETFEDVPRQPPSSMFDVRILEEPHPRVKTVGWFTCDYTEQKGMDDEIVVSSKQGMRDIEGEKRDEARKRDSVQRKEKNNTDEKFKLSRKKQKKVAEARNARKHKREGTKSSGKHHTISSSPSHPAVYSRASHKWRANDVYGKKIL